MENLLEAATIGRPELNAHQLWVSGSARDQGRARRHSLTLWSSAKARGDNLKQLLGSTSGISVIAFVHKVTVTEFTSLAAISEAEDFEPQVGTQVTEIISRIGAPLEVV